MSKQKTEPASMPGGTKVMAEIIRTPRHLAVTIGGITGRIETATIRVLCGASRTPWPIEIVDGDTAPTVYGESWHYETKGGRRIYHPGAYARQGWNNMVYCGSTHRIAVGRDWLLAAIWTGIAIA